MGIRLRKVRYWLGPAATLIAWITVVSYTVSMLASVEPSFRYVLKPRALPEGRRA
jgi:hypothetical protein